MSSRDPEEIWRQLVEEAGADEIERAASVSIAEAEKELAEAGFDVAAERTTARALHDDLQAGRPVSATIRGMWTHKP